MTLRSPSTKSPIWMPIHVAEHCVDTTRQSLAEHGALMRLYYSYWRSGSLRDDDEELARIVGASLREWKSVRKSVELFFEIENGVWQHAFLDAELEKATALIEQNKKRTAAAVRARSTRRIQDNQLHEERNVLRDDGGTRTVTSHQTATGAERDIVHDVEPTTTTRSAPAKDLMGFSFVAQEDQWVAPWEPDS